MNVVKSAPECENLGDIRQGIDDLDRQIVQILARRLTYVKAATRFKASQQAIPAPIGCAQCSKSDVSGPTVQVCLSMKQRTSSKT